MKKIQTSHDFQKTILAVLIITFFATCTASKKSDGNMDGIPEGKIVKTEQGVSDSTLNTVYNGPEGFELVYFPEAIKNARVRYCEIFDEDVKRVTRKTWFDASGNIIKDEFRYFQYWFKGTVNGTLQYYYDHSHRLIKVVANYESQPLKVSISNYTYKGLLHSNEEYEFAQKLKPNADRHLPRPEDYEKDSTWNLIKTKTYSEASNVISITTKFDQVAGIKIIKYVRTFKLNKLMAVDKYENNNLVETTTYSYSNNSITGILKRKYNDGTDFIYHTRVIIDSENKQIEKLLYKNDGTEEVKMTTTYNTDGTINYIKYKDHIQSFKYSYF